VPTGSEVFARTVTALQPYANEVVFIGGWVHALFLAEANAQDLPVRTDDIDVTIPPRLLTGDRPALLNLVGAAGFQIQEIGEASGIVEIFQPGPAESIIELDLLTEAPSPHQNIPIEGQPNLIVHGYPGQHILLENARWIDVGAEVHESLDPPVRIRVPTHPAYILGKGLSSQTRSRLEKRAKDLVYLLEIVRHPVLGQLSVEGLSVLSTRYPAEYRRWRQYLNEAARDRGLLTEVVDQLLAGYRVIGSGDEVARLVTTRLRRLLGETPETTA
jgi:hypothetical protein